MRGGTCGLYHFQQLQAVLHIAGNDGARGQPGVVAPAAVVGVVLGIFRVGIVVGHQRRGGWVADIVHQQAVLVLRVEQQAVADVHVVRNGIFVSNRQRLIQKRTNDLDVCVGDVLQVYDKNWASGGYFLCTVGVSAVFAEPTVVVVSAGGRQAGNQNRSIRVGAVVDEIALIAG